MPLLIGVVLSLSACADRHYERIIVIDPGHGGVDPGAIGSITNLQEKEVALRTGLALRDQLEATGRYRVIMTRDEDRFIELRDRLQIGRQSQGELFISLHADSLMSAPEVSGASVYTLSERVPNEDTARLASNPRRVDILADIKSIRLAELLVQELNGVTRMAKQRRAQAGFVVLTSPETPSVLIELGYLSNPADEQALADDAYIARLATAVARAVDVYFGVEPS